MLVRSPKTEHHVSGKSRLVPLFPELRPYLDESFEQAEPGTEFVITRYRKLNSNLRTQLLRIIKRAGLKPWPKLFQNLRSTRQTELEESFPSHVVCAWLGNSEAVARKHYLQVTDDHFEKAVQNAMQQPAVLPRTGPQPELAAHKKTPVLQGFAAGCEVVQSGRVEDRGLEPLASSCGNTGFFETRAAESGAVGAVMPPDDPRLLRIVSAWSGLPEAIRSAMVAVLDAAE